MEWITVYVSSVTNAMRGKSILEKQGFSVHIQRSGDTEQNNGCGYMLLVRGDTELVRDYLQQAHIRILRIANGGRKP